MSSTRKPKRDTLDQYYTPPELAHACVRQVFRMTGRHKVDALEPSAGSGAWLDALKESARCRLISAVEADPAQCRELERRDWSVYQADFLRWKPVGRDAYDLIVGNPPFNDAEAHIRRAIELLAPNGVLAFVLRLNFLGSVVRAPFYAAHPPSSLHIIRPRPSFTGKGSDSIEYGLFVWGGPQLPIQWLDWEKANKRRTAKP